MKAWHPLVAVFFTSACLAAEPSSCANLASGAVPGSLISAHVVGAGQFAPPQGRGGAAFRELPEFCRVATVLRPSSDSEIKMEVWMPVENWNGKLQAVGNGAWAGSISYPAMATGLAAGYAVASTDTGHSGNTAQFVVGHPEKLVDFAWRAVHEMTLAAKSIVAGYYRKPPGKSYFNGCSTGGRQALAEAQRFPEDYDGIIAGAPANYPTRLQGAQVWTAAVAHLDEASYVPPAKYAAIHRAVLDACDAADGVKDGVLEDPTRCKFDPQGLACRQGDAADCLTAAQVETVRKIYAGPSSARTGQKLFPGLEPGSENGWATLTGPQPMSLAIETYQYLVFQNPAWDFRKFDPDADMAAAEKAIGPTMNSVNPNLKPFFGHGGKLLLYHGWADPGIPPRNTVEYYSKVIDTVGSKTAEKSVRLFMVPGMGHCRGGDGTDTFDPVAALDEWVAKDKAPDRIAASHMTNGVVDRTRPLCPYPEVARYKGEGDTNSAASFICRAP
jgi:feruloyl esterase